MSGSLGIPFSFVGITSSWPLPSSVLCSPHVYSVCRSSDAQRQSVAYLHFLALYLEVPIIFPFYIFFENLIHILLYFPQLLDSSPPLYPVDSFIFFLCLVKTSNSKNETNKTKTKHTRKWFVLAGYCAWGLPWPVVAIYIQSYRTEKNIFPL